jgi:hypothetical protein
MLLLVMLSKCFHYFCYIFAIFRQLTYQYLKQKAENVPIVPVQQEWFDNICKLIPDHLKQTASLQDVLSQLLSEVRSSYEDSIRDLIGNL